MNRVSSPNSHAEKISRLNAVCDVIESRPECWDQTEWHCGTTHCFAGHAQLLAAGFEPDYEVESKGMDEFVRIDAMVWLGLTEGEAQLLFSASNDLYDLRRIIAAMH